MSSVALLGVDGWVELGVYKALCSVQPESCVPKNGISVYPLSLLVL